MVKHLGIIGTGTTGTTIAQMAVLSQIPVSIYDVNGTLLRRSIEQIKSNLRKAINVGKLLPDKLSNVMELLHPRTNLPDFEGCDFIIESVTDDIRVKKDIFKHLGANTKASTILASTTNMFSITSIGALANNKERIIGIHFFNPIESSTIVEIVKTLKTNNETIDKTKSFLNLLGKDFVIINDTPGFVSNRITSLLYNESTNILNESIANVEQIDKIVKTIGGFSQGPFEMMDNIGIDNTLNIIESLYEQTSYDPKYRPNLILKQMVDSGLLGKKYKRGFYSYNEDTGKQP